jgi:hypothetical protein
MDARLRADLHDAHAISRPNFALHTIEMILHCLFGQAKTVGNFLVREALGDQRNQLLFLSRQP